MTLLSSPYHKHHVLHVLLVWQLGLFPQPQAVVDGEPVYGDCQVLSVDLHEFLPPNVGHIVDVHPAIPYLQYNRF